MHKFTILVSLLLLSACAISGQEIHADQLEAFNIGETHISDVEEALGQPTSKSTDSKGYKHLLYINGLYTIKPQTFLPYVGEHVGGTTERTKTYAFSFDHDGLLSNISFSRKKTDGMGSALPTAEK